MGCDARVRDVGVAIVATEVEAGTCKSNVARGSVCRNYDYFLENRDLVDVIN